MRSGLAIASRRVVWTVRISCQAVTAGMERRASSSEVSVSSLSVVAAIAVAPRWPPTATAFADGTEVGSRLAVAWRPLLVAVGATQIQMIIHELPPHRRSRSSR